MSNVNKVTGTCLCGKVTLALDKVDRNVGVCHCNMCRTWGGGPLLAVDCQAEVTIDDDQDSVSVFDSSEWAERGFCRGCGTHLFYRIKATGQIIVPAGLLGIESEYTLDHQIFIDEKPRYYDFAQQTKNMTGEEVFAMFSDES